MATDIPAIRTFQFDAQGSGDLAKSVNLTLTCAAILIWGES
jgi:hypothetical protein